MEDKDLLLRIKEIKEIVLSLESKLSNSVKEKKQEGFIYKSVYNESSNIYEKELRNLKTITESITIGAAGTKCPRCNGTGSV